MDPREWSCRVLRAASGGAAELQTESLSTGRQTFSDVLCFSCAVLALLQYHREIGPDRTERGGSLAGDGQQPYSRASTNAAFRSGPAVVTEVVAIFQR